MEKTFILLKPDSLQRGLMGSIIQRFEAKGLQIMGIKMMMLTTESVEQLYPHHTDKEFFPRLTRYMTASPIVAILLEGYNAIQEARRLCGNTDPGKADPGTIRGDWSLTKGCNLIHASDSPENARREQALFFQDHEIFMYSRNIETWLLEELWE